MIIYCLHIGMEFYRVRKRMRMKRLIFIVVAGICLSACGDDIPADAGKSGQGSMPADTTVQRVNQGAIGTDLGGSTRKPDSSQGPATTPTQDSARQ
jgi:hypothetical protein